MESSGNDVKGVKDVNGFRDSKESARICRIFEIKFDFIKPVTSSENEPHQPLIPIAFQICKTFQNFSHLSNSKLTGAFKYIKRMSLLA